MKQFANLPSPLWKLCFHTFIGATALFFAGCSFTGKQSTLDPKGPVAQTQLDLFWITVYVCVIIFVIVASCLAFVVVKFRERPGQENEPMPSQGHGNPLIEIGLIGSSIFLLVIIAVPTLKAIWFTHELPEDQPYYEESLLKSWYPERLDKEVGDEVLEVTAYGWQWWWSFEYPQLGITTGNELVIPVGKVVKINLRSVDVIHSFWLPKIAGKVDLMPGRTNWMWIKADEEGHYYGQCAEYCGEAHAYMLFRSDALPESEFYDWVEKNKNGAPAPGGFKATPTAEKPVPTAQEDWQAWMQKTIKDPNAFEDSAIHRGAKLFMGKGQCIMCHRIGNSPAMGAKGPDLTLIGMRKSVAAGILDNLDANGNIDPAKQLANLKDWVQNSQHIKPGNLMYYGDAAFADIQKSAEAAGDPFTDQDYEDIAKFLQSLK